MREFENHLSSYDHAHKQVNRLWNISFMKSHQKIQNQYKNKIK